MEGYSRLDSTEMTVLWSTMPTWCKMDSTAGSFTVVLFLTSNRK